MLKPIARRALTTLVLTALFSLPVFAEDSGTAPSSSPAPTPEVTPDDNAQREPGEAKDENTHAEH